MEILKQWIISRNTIELDELKALTLNIIDAVDQRHNDGEIITNLKPTMIKLDPDTLVVEIETNDFYDVNDAYTAPEIFLEKKLVPQNDVYSIGAIFYELVFGENFWEEKDLDEDSFKEFLKNNEYGIDIDDLDGCDIYLPFFKTTLAIDVKQRGSLSDIKGLVTWDASNEVDEIISTNKFSESTVEEELDVVLVPMDGKEIGIDLGTTNSVVSYIENSTIKTFRYKNGAEVEPSAIFFQTPTKQIFGRKAYEKGLDNPQSCIRLFKRKLKDKKDVFQIEFYNKQTDIAEPTEQVKSYIFDTNVFIDEPFILNDIPKQHIIILSKTVLEELQFLKNQKSEVELQADEAIKQISEISKIRNIRFEDSDVSLLSGDLFTNSKSQNDINDNKVLSIAIKLQNQAPILVTSDRALQFKARNNPGKAIECLSLADFKLDQPITTAKATDMIRLTGEEASALFLRYLRETVSDEVGYVSRAVITVPANFSNVEIEATKNAGLEAGFSEIKIIKEPTAAAIAYGFEEQEPQTILVYDFGGGTFDVSIIESDGHGVFNVIATGGNPNLGGEDVTGLLIDWIYEKLEDQFDLDMSDIIQSCLPKEEFAYNTKSIYKVAENVKAELSYLTTTSVELLNIYTAPGEIKSVSLPITRIEFEREIKQVIIEAQNAMIKTLEKAKIQAEDIDTVILAGGTSLIPAIHENVEKTFGKKPFFNKNTATVISQGAALVADAEWNRSEEGITDIILIDKTITAFGVSLQNRRFDQLIAANEELPVRLTKEYALVKDYQENLKIEVFTREEGLDHVVRIVDEGIEFLDKIYITNLPRLKQTEAVIEVTFEISQEYILNVSAKVKDKFGKELTSKSLTVAKESRQKQQKTMVTS